jgi:hypothetical protein
MQTSVEASKKAWTSSQQGKVCRTEASNVSDAAFPLSELVFHSELEKRDGDHFKRGVLTFVLVCKFALNETFCVGFVQALASRHALTFFSSLKAD